VLKWLKLARLDSYWKYQPMRFGYEKTTAGIQLILSCIQYTDGEDDDEIVKISV